MFLWPGEKVFPDSFHEAHFSILWADTALVLLKTLLRSFLSSFIVGKRSQIQGYEWARR
jgi:hypothetical protein